MNNSTHQSRRSECTCSRKSNRHTSLRLSVGYSGGVHGRLTDGGEHKGHDSKRDTVGDEDGTGDGPFGSSKSDHTGILSTWSSCHGIMTCLSDETLEKSPRVSVGSHSTVTIVVQITSRQFSTVSKSGCVLTRPTLRLWSSLDLLASPPHA